MNILSWIIFGLIVGVVANLIDPRPAKGGIFGAIILGILGSLLGGFLGNMLFGVSVTGFNFGSFAVAVAGALVLLVIGRLFSRPTEYR
jgi:uncharacterized membrane protein YeaQ/YmgE (transglycosylase-associated protein family)